MTQSTLPCSNAAIGASGDPVSIPDVKLATLVQPEGRLWRSFRMSGLFWTATAVILITLAGLAAFVVK